MWYKFESILAWALVYDKWVFASPSVAQTQSLSVQSMAGLASALQVTWFTVAWSSHVSMDQGRLPGLFRLCSQ